LKKFIKKNISSIDDAIQTYFSEEKIENVECICCSKDKFVKACFETIEKLENKENNEEKKEFLVLSSKKAIELYNQTQSALISHEEMIKQLEIFQNTRFKNLTWEEQSKLKIIYFKMKSTAILSSKIAKYPVILLLNEFIILIIKDIFCIHLKRVGLGYDSDYYKSEKSVIFNEILDTRKFVLKLKKCFIFF
jgi:hypothetical protein